MTELTEVTLPGMPDLPPLWAVHAQGSDDIYAMPNQSEAETFKQLLDELDAKNAGRKFMPKNSAVIIEWQGTREDHAALLIEQERG